MRNAHRLENSARIISPRMSGCEVGNRLFLLVVIDKLDSSGDGGAAGEADAPLVIHADAVLAGAAAARFSGRLPGGTRRSLMLRRR